VRVQWRWCLVVRSLFLYKTKSSDIDVKDLFTTIHLASEMSEMTDRCECCAVVSCGAHCPLAIHPVVDRMLEVAVLANSYDDDV
jgi:hypothetical protein